jgi:plasmid stabilization system protein ParE
MESIDNALSRITRNPKAYPIVYRTLRRAVVRRFPFSIFYEITLSEIRVIAVFHSRRDPERWKRAWDSQPTQRVSRESTNLF